MTCAPKVLCEWGTGLSGFRGEGPIQLQIGRIKFWSWDRHLFGETEFSWGWQPSPIHIV